MSSNATIYNLIQARSLTVRFVRFIYTPFDEIIAAIIRFIFIIFIHLRTNCTQNHTKQFLALHIFILKTTAQRLYI